MRGSVQKGFQRLVGMQCDNLVGNVLQMLLAGREYLRCPQKGKIEAGFRERACWLLDPLGM
jgi:hypothetical protein